MCQNEPGSLSKASLLMSTIIQTIWRRLFGRAQVTTLTQDSQLKGFGDAVIVVIGPTGSGKSTLINAIIGEDVALVGHGLSTCTQQVEAYKLPQDIDPGRTVVLVDTPGFDDTAMHDSTRVFKAVVQWIAEYPKKQEAITGSRASPPQIVGFIYLQDISQKRINNRQNIDFSRLQHFLGEVSSGSGHGSSYKKLFLVTYQWPAKPPSIEPKSSSTPADVTTTTTPPRGMSASQSLVYQQAEDREKELRNKFWKDLLENGARMLRVEDSGHPRRVVLDILNAQGSISSSPDPP